MESRVQSREVNVREGNWKGLRYFSLFYEEHRSTPWFYRRNDLRRFTVLFNRLRANHYNLNESLGRKNFIDHMHCDCGAEYEDIHHVLFHCHFYKEARENMYKRLRKKSRFILILIKLLRDKIGMSYMAFIISFLKSTGLFRDKKQKKREKKD